MKKIISVITGIILAGSFIFAETEPAFKELDMVHVPETLFVIGKDVQSITATRSVEAFSINKYETTYTLWYKVRKEAEKIGYTFKNPGQEGSMGRRGRAPTEKGFGQPVTMISWYDAIVWCNALSELNGLTPVYTYKGRILKDSSNTAFCDLTECNFTASGYRLPTEAEWEWAATSPSLDNDYTQNTTSHGYILGFDDEEKQNEYASYYWCSNNASSTHRAGTAGTPFNEDAPPLPGTGKPNMRGIFDMTGNVLEYCFDWFANHEKQDESDKYPHGPEYGEQRVSKGGSFSEYTMFNLNGDRYSFDPNEYYNYMGFRVVQSK